MAVLLCRSDGKPFPAPPPPELQGLPKVIMESKPLPDHDRHQIASARSDKVYATKDQHKEETWKNSRERHLEQLTECGFFSTAIRPYKDMGEVILDDRKLILEDLGQADQANGETSDIKESVSPPSSSTQHHSVPQPSACETRLPSTAPTSHYHTGQIFTLDQGVSQGNRQLNRMRKGIELSKLIAEEEVEKVLRKKSKKLDVDKFKMTEAEVDGDAANAMDTSNTSRRKSVHSVVRLEEEEDANFMESLMNSSDMWHQKLSVMVWVLETMKAEHPWLCKPFATCWNKLEAVHTTSDKESMYSYVTNLLRTLDAKELLSRDLLRHDSVATTTRLPSRLSSIRGISRAPTELLSTTTQYPGGDGLASDVTLDVGVAEKCFNDVKAARDRIINEQLKVKDRDRSQGTKERFSLLQITGNMHADLKSMRENICVESTETARKRLLINLEWYEQLLAELPQEVKRDHYCCQRLTRLKVMANYIKIYTDKMDKTLIMEVIGTLRPWELKLEEIDCTMKYLIKKVIYYGEEDYDAWFCHHTTNYSATKDQEKYHVTSVDGHRLPELKAHKRMKRRVLDFLVILRSWELNPEDTDHAIKYLIRKVIYHSEEDYDKWLSHYITTYSAANDHEKLCAVSPSGGHKLPEQDTFKTQGIEGGGKKS